MKLLLGIGFLFWVLVGAAVGLPAVILGLAPNTGNLGQTFLVDIRGLGFPASVSSASVTFGSDITVTSAQRLPDEMQDIDGQAVNVSSIRVQVSISPSAYAGTRAVLMVSVASFSAAVFTVVNPSASPPPGADLTFNQQSDIPAMRGPNEVAGYDFTGDSLTDLAVGAPGQNSLLLYTGLAAGRFGGPKRIRNDNAVASLVEIADMNGDGKADLVTGDENAPRVEIWINSSGLTFRKPAHVNIPASPWGLAVGDFNGDGRKDVVVAARDIDRAVLLLGSASGAFEPPRVLAAGITPKAAASGDFDRDGLEDAVVANYTNGISIYRGSISTGLLPQKRKPSP
ncbi:MAG TPA: VCBS repeat-containing protein, partial [Acidobacteriota bacterium]|nr:VCBS repeat-containing protein [Acidobacteriota bacterium]